jgi:reverse gyrase
MGEGKSVVPVGVIQQRIFLIRGVKVIVDADLAEFYGVPTKRLNEQVKRNVDRFPADFMFQLEQEEKDELVAKCDHLSGLKHSKALPRVFTEHGAIMAASVLNTPRAVEMSVFVVRAFVRLREVLSEHRELAKRVAALETHLAHHDEHILALFSAIKELMSPEELPEPRRIGFRPNGT